MRRITAIFFFTIVLVSQTPLQQLLKLPVLFQHYMEHKDPANLSFLDYIEEHYFNGNPRDEDYPRDQQLPFRTAGVILIGTTVDLPVQASVEPAPVVYVDRSYSLELSTSFTSRHASEIWQPPRTC